MTRESRRLGTLPPWPRLAPAAAPGRVPTSLRVTDIAGSPRSSRGQRSHSTSARPGRARAASAAANASCAIRAAIPDHHRRNVVTLRRATGELTDGGEDMRHESLGAGDGGRLDGGEQPVVSQFVAFGVHRLGDAVTEDHDGIARNELDRVLAVRRELEQADDRAAFLEAPDATGPHHER